LQQLRAALDKLVEQGAICEGDAAVLEEHLFKMQVLAGAVQDRAAKDPKKPVLLKEFTPDLQAAAIRKLSESVSKVLATTQAARKEAESLLTRIKEGQSATQEDQTRLATLQQSQEATRQLLQWEEKLRALTAAKAVEVFQATDKELQAKLAGLPKERSAYEEALVSLGQARARLEGLKDPLFRQVEKELLMDRQRIADELRKWAGLERVEKDMGGKPPALAPEKKADAPAKNSSGLARAQQMLSTWARTAQEQEEKQKELLKAHAAVSTLLDHYAGSLAEVRRLAVQQHASAIDLKKRLGRGELEAGAVPDRVTEALKRDLLTELEAKASGLVNARTPLQEERKRLEKPNADLQQARTLVKELLTSIGRRLDLSDELERLESETKKERERSESENKRIEQTVASRLSGGDTFLDFFLSIDTSPGGKRLTELLQSYYRELIELEGREEGLDMQKKKIDQLIEAAQKESSQIAQTIPHLQKLTERLGGEREAQLLLVRARLRPDEVDELLKAHQARTGRALNRPPPVADNDKAALVESAAREIFEDVVREEAAKRWVAFLAERLSPAGIDTEVGRYQDKLGALFAARGTLQRRVRFLTGASADAAAKAPADEPGSGATGGEIARVRAERTSIRRGGVLRIVIKIAVVLALAFLFPRLANWFLVRLARRRGKATAHGDLVISLIGVFIKLAIWIAALVVILSTLGFDITAILAALGIGGLAIGLAAQDTIADVISGILIFMERPFSINDTVVLGNAEPAKVVGLTWRATRLRSPLGADLSVPNRQVTRGAIRNLTRDGQTLDSLVFPLRAGCPIDQSLVLMEEALNGCELASREGQRGVDAQTVELANAEPFVKYTLWWHVHEIDRGSLVRAEVLGRVTTRLREAGLLAIPPSARKTESPGTGQQRQNPTADSEQRRG
jgi:small-conductance mechanosensitive channel